MNARPEPADGLQAERFVFPASFAQQRLWFIEQLEGAGAAWNVRLPVRLSGPLDVALLERALAAVVARHEALRTTFGMRGGEIVQFVVSSLEVPVERVPLPPPAAAEPAGAGGEERLRQLLGRLAGHVFNLREGPLLRAFLVEVGPDDHALLLLAHHIISDAWSSGILFRDLAAAYDAFTRGSDPRLPELPVQYADFAAWQSDMLTGPELERQVAFWRGHLAGAPVLLDLPVDHPRPRLQTYRGSRLGRGLSPELTARVRQLAAAEGVTLFMLLFAAFNVLLSRWTGQQDIVVGTPIAGRRRTELEGLVGFFANTLALRTRIDAAGPFRELLRQVRATALEAFAHQDLPFEKLVEVLQPPRNLAHSPVFQVLFVLQNAPWEAERFGDLRVSPAEIAPGDTTRLDLSVSVAEFEGRLWLGLEYSTDLFEEGTIGRLATGIEALLAAVVADPGALIAALPVQAAADLDRQLRDWQPVPTAVPAPDIGERFAAQVRRTPEAIAAECDGVRITYAGLAARAGAVAAGLRAAGITADVPVALCVGRSPDMLAAVLGVLQAGGHYLPLDPAHPPARLAFVLKDSGARLLLASPPFLDRFRDFRGVVLDVSAVGAASAATPFRLETRGLDSRRKGVAAEAAPTEDGETPAYLIYTSGSTGQPKGVVVPRRAVANFLTSMADTPGLAAGDRLLAVTTLAFDIAVLELLLPLTVGATTVIATEEEVRDPRCLMALLDRSGVTVMQATPALWRSLVASGWAGSAELRLLCGGEALDRELAGQLLRRGRELWNLYGPTETTVWSCVGRVTDEAGPVSIGSPIANTRCYVLDDQLQPVPIGARGELWIGGAGVALGYHARPALTAGRFLPDPFAPGRLYRTGDRARWREDGRLEVLGRTDFQLKLRGFRLEPGEIESVIVGLPGVSAAVVVLREIAGDARLVAYVVAREQPVPDESLLAELRRSLPAYMVPSRIVWLSALPLTPNGKVDRTALPAVDAVGAASAATGEIAVAPEGAPTTSSEMALCRIFSELLGAPVGLDDDFFGRGGHSLLATRLVARLEAELHVTLPLRAVFEAPTVRGLAAQLPAGLPAGAPLGATPEADRSRLKALLPEATAPLSLVQQRLWFLDRLQPGNSAYHLAWAVGLRGELDQRALQAALDGLAARHGSLRTHFRDRDGEPEQVIGPPAGLPLQVVTADAAQLAARIGDFAAAPFSLAEGPLVRALLVRSGPVVHTLVLVIHHIVADGWSLGILNRELGVLYAAARRGASAGLPPLALDYAAYAREQRRALAGGELARQLAWWQEQLRDAPPFLALPNDRPRAAVASGRGARLSRTLPRELQEALGALARAEGCTLFMVLLAAFDVLLARQAGTEDVVVGTPIAGRPRAELEGLVGFFVNTLVLRTDLRGDPTVRALLGRVRDMTLGAYEHAEVPFELLVESLQPPRSTNRTPLFQVLFNLHSEPGAPLALDGIEVRPVAVPRQTAKFDLGVSLAETTAGLAVAIEYSSDLFLAGTIERFLADYAVVLSGFVANPSARLTGLPFSPPERESAVSVAPVTPLTLAAAFAEQVETRPAVLAVSAPASSRCPGVDWSYGALAGEAGTIAAALLRQGLQPGDRVGLWFGQGAGQVAGILGALQAGAVYVPLDPLAPPARLGRVIRDAGLRIVVTDLSAPDWPAALAGGGLVVLRREELPAAPGPARCSTHPDALAYLLYTSGSTGTPKGVPQTHRNVLHFVRAWSGNLGLDPDDRLSLLSTYGYDAAVQDIFGALLAGASVCPLDVRGLDRETLLDRIADRRLTVLHGTPTAYRYLFGGHVACRQDLSRVRLVVLGGEVARRADFELFRARFRRGARFVNGYGLTEATAVTQWFADHDTHPRGQQLPIGRPLVPAAEGERVLLLDESGAPAAIAGELVIESACVTPGYWPIAVGAASAAIPLPLETRGLDSRGKGIAAEAAPTAVRRFHTGDHARYLPDGNLVFVGRRDERVKIGGVRIEPGEIEAGLRALPEIDEAVVLVVEEVPGEPVLTACFTTRPGATGPALPALREHLATLLPAALIPARLTPCDQFPRLPNGKVDRRALAAVGAASAATGGSRSERLSERRESAVAAEAAPTGADEVEATLRDIWQALLKRDSVGPDEDFFLLGGHSLLATRLVARIRDRLGVELPLIRVFEAPTIRGLARFLRPGGIRMPAPDDYSSGVRLANNSPTS